MSEVDLNLRLLGIPGIYWQNNLLENPTPKLLAMLCYLAVQEKPVTRSELAELFWEVGKTESVRSALYSLKKMPYSEKWLLVNKNFVEVKAKSDARNFKQAMREKHYAESISIWQQNSVEGTDFLEALEFRGADNFKHWLEQERNTLQELYLEALQARLAELQEANDIENALELAYQWVKEDPLSESAHQAVMLLKHLQGHTDVAFEQFESYCQTLRVELNLEPSPEMLKFLGQLEQGGNTRTKSALWLKEPNNIPQLPEKLIGRDALLTEILKMLEQNQRVLLHGFAGVGKTALATAIAAQKVNQAQGVVWLQLGNDNAASLFDSLARPFAAQQSLGQTKETAKPKLLKALLRKHGIRLVIFDDAWNAYALSKLLEVIPENTALLVTSRQRYPKLEKVYLTQLEPKDALNLLSFVAQQDFSQDAHASELCELMAYNAFALQVAGKNLILSKHCPQRLLTELQEFPHTLTMPAEFKEENKESVTNLLEISLESLSDEAYETFIAMGVLFTPSCTPELLALCLRRSIDSTENALMELAQQAIVDRVSEAGSDVITYRLHDLAFSLAKANKSLRKVTLVKACLEFTKHHYENFVELEAELGNLLSSLDFAKERGRSNLLIDMMYLLVVKGNAYYAARGHSPHSLELLEAATQVAKQSQRIEEAHYLSTKLANAFRELLGDSQSALKYYKQALELAIASNNTPREAILLSLVGLTSFECNLKSEHYFQKAYALANSLNDDLAFSHVLQNMSYMAGVKGNFEQAKELSIQAIMTAKHLRKSAGAAKTRGTNYLFYALLNLGEAEKELGNLEQALEKRKEALELAQSVDNQLWMAYSLQEIAEIYHNLAQKDVARKSYLKALSLYEQNNHYSKLEEIKDLMKTAGYLCER